jgi:copper resistance protein D
MTGDGVSDLLIVIRAIHFAATATTTGTIVFRATVADAALHSAETLASVVRTQIRRVAWIGLVITAASGAIWLLLEAAAMSGRPFSEAVTSAVLWTVVNETQFGRVFEIRFVLAMILAACLAYDRFPLARWLALALALGLVAAIAWTGHAGSTVGELGLLHLTADTLHLIASAAWIGGLVPFAWLLAATRRYHHEAWARLAGDVTQRFSKLGIVSVVILLGSGIVNAWMLVGSVNGLIRTQYGNLLLLKIALFAAMVGFAAVNRFWLTPRLTAPSGNAAQRETLRQLTRNSMIEIALALMIFAIVGMLGTWHPAIHVLATSRAGTTECHSKN